MKEDKPKKNAAGKGMKPIVGYNLKNWYRHYDEIFRKKQKNIKKDK